MHLCISCLFQTISYTTFISKTTDYFSNMRNKGEKLPEKQFVATRYQKPVDIQVIHLIRY